MAGLLVTSIVSGQLISRLGRYKRVPDRRHRGDGGRHFLLSRLERGHERRWSPSLVHARARPRPRHGHAGARARGAERGRPFELHGRRDVAARRSSARSAARSASPLFGAIFANRLHGELSARLPAGVQIPTDDEPADDPAICRRPVHAAFEQAFAAALHPVFLSAAVGVCSPSRSPGCCARCRCAAARTRPTRFRRSATSVLPRKPRRRLRRWCRCSPISTI